MGTDALYWYNFARDRVWPSINAASYYYTTNGSSSTAKAAIKMSNRYYVRTPNVTTYDTRTQHTTHCFPWWCYFRLLLPRMLKVKLQVATADAAGCMQQEINLARTEPPSPFTSTSPFLAVRVRRTEK